MRSLALAALLWLLSPAPAAADEDRAADLFDDGKRLLAKKNYAKACPAFAASYEADPTLGTLVELAGCYEKWGKWVDAYKAYSKAASIARDDNDDRFSKLRQKSEGTGRKIARLTVRIPKDVGARATFTFDGKSVERDAFGEELVLEPGSHTIAAKLPSQGMVSETLELEMGSREQRQLKVKRDGGKLVAEWTSEVDAPTTVASKAAPKPDAKTDAKAATKADTKSEARSDAKSDAKAEAKAEPKPDPQPDDTATKPEQPDKQADKPATTKTKPAAADTGDAAPTRNRGRLFGGIALTVAGAGALGASSYIALGARSDYKAVEAMCPGGKCATMEAFDTTRDAKAKARTMTYVFAGGLGLAAVGVYLIATSAAEPTERATATVFFTDGGGGLAIGGSL